MGGHRHPAQHRHSDDAGRRSDPVDTNDSAEDSTTLEPRTDLAITNGQSSAVAGEAVTYTVTVSNLGPSNAVGAIVEAPFSGDFSAVSRTCQATGSGTLRFVEQQVPRARRLAA